MMAQNPKQRERAEPSNLAIQHEREITELRTGHQGILRELGTMQTWMQKQERHLELFMDEVRGLFNRNNQRNPALYVGLASVILVMLTMASGLTIFTINALNGPMRTQIDDNLKRTEALENRERADHELLVRLDERDKMRREMSLPAGSH